MKDTVGGRIRARREALGWSQGQLAKKAETGRSLIGRYERDLISPSVHRLIALGRAMGIQPQLLMPGIALVDDEPMPHESDFQLVPLAFGLPKRAWSEVLINAPVRVPADLLNLQSLSRPVVVREIGITDMIPIILPTDSVLVDIGRDKPRWGELVVVRHQDKVLVRWFMRSKRSNWLEAEDPKFPPMKVVMRDVELLGVITTMIWRYPTRRDATHGVSK